jgi:hypothetical protein
MRNLVGSRLGFGEVEHSRGVNSHLPVQRQNLLEYRSSKQVKHITTGSCRIATSSLLVISDR